MNYIILIHVIIMCLCCYAYRVNFTWFLILNIINIDFLVGEFEPLKWVKRLEYNYFYWVLMIVRLSWVQGIK